MTTTLIDGQGQAIVIERRSRTCIWIRIGDHILDITSETDVRLSIAASDEPTHCSDCGHEWRWHSIGGLCQGTARGIVCHCSRIGMHS